MTKKEFLEQVTDYDALKEALYDLEYDLSMFDVYDFGEVSQKIDDRIQEYLVDHYWYDLYDELGYIRDYADNNYRDCCLFEEGDGLFDFVEITADDFDRILERVVDYLEDHGDFDDDFGCMDLEERELTAEELAVEEFLNCW